jgi:hypothetical protein
MKHGLLEAGTEGCGLRGCQGRTLMIPVSWIKYARSVDRYSGRASQVRLRDPTYSGRRSGNLSTRRATVRGLYHLLMGGLRLNPYLQYKQDGAPCHSAAFTVDELRNRGITPIFWPGFSPDLNPIEAVWKKMKDWIKPHHPDLPAGKQRTYDQLRGFYKRHGNLLPLRISKSS